MKQRIGDINTVTNKKPKPGAKAQYSHVRVQLEDGTELSLLFTDSDMRRGAERAKKNPEDVPKVGRIRNFFD